MPKLSLFLVSVLFTMNAFAEGISDAALLANAIKQLEQLREQYKILSETYANGKAQLEGIKALKTLNSGNYGFGNLNNSLSDLKNRQWSADTWEEALNNIAGGNPSRYQELVKAYQKNNIILSDEEYAKGATPERLKQYQQFKAINQTISVQSTYAYNEVNTHLKAIHNLASHIEKTQNTKAAVDLNSRLLAEIAYIQTETLKLQTLLTQQTAFASSTELSTDSELAKFNKLPDV